MHLALCVCERVRYLDVLVLHDRRTASSAIDLAPFQTRGGRGKYQRLERRLPSRRPLWFCILRGMILQSAIGREALIHS